MEDGLSLKEAQGGGSRARRGEQGDADGFGRRRSGMLPRRDPAPSYGNGSRDPGSWTAPGPGEGGHDLGEPGPASHCVTGTGCAPVLLLYRRIAAGNSLRVRLMKKRGRESRD